MKQSTVATQEIRSFVELYERLEEEKKDIADQQKEVMAEAKGRGYDTKALTEIIKLRKISPDDRASRQAMIDLYAAALDL